MNRDRPNAIRLDEIACALGKRKMPCACRSSGTSGSLDPWQIWGVRTGAGVPSITTAPVASVSLPKFVWASTARPVPSTPEIPAISPGWTLKLASRNTRLDSPRTSSTG
jgi:hypothetical protein